MNLRRLCYNEDRSSLSLHNESILEMAPEKCALEQGDGGYSYEKIMGEEGEGWERTRWQWWVALSGAITPGRVGLSTHTAETTWNVDLIF